jgi:signal transduction histidine kinase
LPGEWAPIATLVAEAYAATTETTHGPFIEPDGHAIFHHYLPVTRGMRRGALVAIIDANDLLEALLIDEAPGYEIRVTCCDGIELYRRGTADAALPTPWREGRISPARGILWSVAHRPSPMLADDLENVAVDLVLIAGLALALVLGGLVFQTQRAAERAAAASAAEQRVRKLNRELEDRVVTRTKKLNDALTDFNTINLSVAHDLRSPLNAVSLLAGQVRQGNQHDTVAAGRCDKITANVERMAGITDRLLGYSRASSFDSQLEDVDMRAMAEQVVREQSIAPETVSIGALPHARADGLIIHILLSNLVGNAAKHGQSDQGPRIEIGSRAIADGGIAYFVRDDGPGIEKELADRLFKPMTERRKNGEGLGLGLAISARAVERHHGRIWVESEPGNGATFLFTLNDANVDSGQERH